MTENIPQTSTSERIEQAREALAEYEEALSDHTRGIDSEATHNAINALRALITPPSVGEALIDTAADISERRGYESNGVDEAVLEGIEYGIQYAHERWEPADRPSQEQMLRWLGIEYTKFTDVIAIGRQNIEREES